jgi:lactoylglutathione lyase
MKRVTGLGGAFFKCADPVAQRAWYAKHLGIESTEYGATFEWRSLDNPDDVGATAWNTFPANTKYFQPSEKPFMFNYRVENLAALFELFKQEGVQIVGGIDDSDFGKFGWIMDPEGNKIELWEPPAPPQK